MTFKSKDQTESTPLLSSEGSTEVLGQPSSPSATADSTPVPTKITEEQSTNTLPVEKSDKTTVNALMMRAALLSLERVGLAKRFTVSSKRNGKTVVKEIRVVFDPGVWSEDLKLLSKG